MNHRYDLFKKRREHLKLSFADVRRQCGLAKGTIIKAEDPKGNPQASTLRILSESYGLDPSLSMDFKLNGKRFHRAVVKGAG